MGRENRTSTQGPDLTDVATMMVAMESLHQVSMEIVIRPCGRTFDGETALTVVATTRRGILEEGAPLSRALTIRWPNSGSATPEALMYRMLHQMDAKLSQENWGQLLF